MKIDIENEAIRQVLKGYSDSDILEFLVEESADNPEQMLKDAKDSLKNVLSESVEYKKAFSEAATKNLYNKMLEIGDYSGALGAIKELNKMNDLYACKIKTGQPITGKQLKKII